MAEAKFQGFERCKSCTSKYCKDINQKLEAGESQRSISKWLEAQGESISQASIGRHYKNHVLKKRSNAGYKKAVNRASDIRANHDHWKSKDQKSTSNPPNNNPPVTNQTLCKTQGELIYEKMKEEFDAFNEMLKTIAIQKARMNAGLQEEQDAKMLLNTVDKSINTYAQLIAKFRDMMSGADSLERLRMVQLQNMIATIFSGENMPDNVKFTMMNLLAPASTPDQDKDVRVQNPIRPVQS